jgi:signal transduction histidine kinase
VHSFLTHFVKQIARVSERSRAANHRLAHVVLVIGTVAACTVSWWGSGIYSPSLLWLAILPTAAVFFLSQTATMIWLVLIALILMVLSVAGYMRLQASPQMQVDISGISMAMHLVLAQVCVMLIHWVYDWQYRQKSSRIAASIQKMKVMQHKLQAMETYKDRFIATVSEDLRLPMNAILGYSDVLAAMAANKPELIHTVEHIRTSTQQLLKMTNNILDHARLNAGQLQLNYKPMSLKRVIQNEWIRGSVNTEVDFKIVVQQNMPEWLWCDEERFKQIVGILLDNAKKFTSQGHVLLEFGHQNSVLHIDIRDTGVGIAEDIKPYIFKRFDKGDEAMQQKFGGIGLGLANALALTQLFGGTIGFESTKGQGAHFWVRLPIPNTDVQQVAQSSASTGED